MSAADRPITELLASLCDETISADEMQRLDHLICTDPSARRLYLEYLDLHARLSFQGSVPGGDECGLMNDELPESASGEWSVEGGERSIHYSAFIIQPSAFSPLSPLPSLFFSYTIAALVLGTALAVAWVWKLPGYTQIVVQPVPNSSPLTPGPSSKMEFVGQVTGMIACEWANASTATVDRTYVPLGRTYALASGLMEITYDTGVKVILQGPCTYEVESKAGGFLSLGKLTAKVESNEQRRTKNEELSSSRSSFLIPHSYFAIRTPAATVTDLGTEFGVEVSENLETRVHVLEGVVEARSLDGRGSIRGVETVTEGHAVCVSPRQGGCKATEFLPTTFVRSLSEASDSPAERAYIAAVLADKPLGYWPLNEATRLSRFHDRSGNGFHGDAMNRVASELGGPLAKATRAITLDGHGYLDMGCHKEFSLVNGFTVEAWMCIGGNMDPDGWIISAADGERTLGWGFGAGSTIAGSDVPARGSIRFVTWCIQDYRFPIPSEWIGKDRWLHAAIVCDAKNTAHLYVNGALRESSPGTKPALSGPVWLTIGCETPMSRGWQGRLAHVAVYPRALSQERILNHFNQKNKNDAVLDK